MSGYQCIQLTKCCDASASVWPPGGNSGSTQWFKCDQCGGSADLVMWAPVAKVLDYCEAVCQSGQWGDEARAVAANVCAMLGRPVAKKGGGDG